MFQFEIDESNPNSVLIDNTSREILTDFKVDDRIISEKDVGVVRYIGPVNPHPGIWLGIEWNNLSRGKHDGSVDGVQYFKCSTPNCKAASFIRPHKAKKIKDIVSALHERYGHDPEVMSTLRQIDDRMEKTRIVYSELRVLDLSAREISDLDNFREVLELCPNIQFLNLAENLITSWDLVAQLCSGLSYLRRLDVSDNPMDERQANVENMGSSFQTVEHLILGQMKYDWSTIMKFSILWPQLINLQLQFNTISTIVPSPISLQNLTSLDLEGNQITSWEEVIKLNVCNRLEYLNLCGNKIEIVQFPLSPNLDNNIQNTDIFPNLLRLNLTENRIQNWVSVNELNKLSKLKELRIDLNRFLEKDARSNNRQMIIARMGRLQKLEGVEINRQERRDAELDYVKIFSTKWNVKGTDVQFATEHPRYVELVKKLGASQVGEVSSGVKTMQTSLITLEFIPENTSYKPYSKQLMPNMTVQKLKMLLQRNFKLRSSRIGIQVVSARNPSISFTLENDFFDLTQYSVEDGDKLLLTW